MSGKCVYNLIIGGFKFYGNVSKDSLRDVIEIPENLGICTKLLSCSPFEIMNKDIDYNSKKYNFQNNFFNTHYFVHFDKNEVKVNCELNSGEEFIVEHSYIYTKYCGKKAKKKHKLEALQFKIENNTSLCIGSKYVSNLTLYKLEKDIRIFACKVNNNIYYDEIPDSSSEAIIYYFQIIPYSDIFINDKTLFTDELHIKNSIIKTIHSEVKPQNCFIISQNKNKYLVAIIK